MPADNIKRAIMKGTGQLEGSTIEEIIYEGYGPGGVALYITALSDNKNRTVSEVRHIFAKNGGRIGEQGCVAYRFKRQGYIAIEKSKATEEQLMEIALTAGAEDVKDEDANWEIITTPDAYEKVLEAVKAAGIEIADSNVGYIPQDYTHVEGQAGRTEPEARGGIGGPRRRPDRRRQFRHRRKGNRTPLTGLRAKPDEGPGNRSEPPVHGIRRRRGEPGRVTSPSSTASSSRPRSSPSRTA